METSELVKLERIARNLPCRKINMEYCEGDYGRICFAYGTGPSTDDPSKEVMHGVWGCQGVAMTMEMDPDASIDAIRQALVDAAARSVHQLWGKGIING